jgi:RimJ/RimL family protein N-acetyltransferase
MVRIREITVSDVPFLLDYWFSADDEYLIGMGVDLAKMPNRYDFEAMLMKQIDLPYNQKASYGLILDIEGKPSGHTNVNEITFGDKAKMHLHIWDIANRVRGAGTTMIRLALPKFFAHLQLKAIYCEPYVHNPSPHKTLAKVGFELIKTYTTIPGSFNFEQEVHQWCMTKDVFENLNT